MWAQRVVARRGQPAHVLLELRADASAEDVQAAFHKVARTAHPDLHRQGLTPAELELVTSAYAAVAGAYQELRTKTMATTRMQPLRRPDEAPAPAATPAAPASQAPPSSTPPGGTATARAASPRAPSASPAASPSAAPPSNTPSGLPGGMKPEQAMSSKALLYYRKAELALRRGDLKGAILQLKLACATDPASAFLKTALAEVETEVRKST